MSLLLWILALTGILLALGTVAGDLTASRWAKVLLLPGFLVALVARSLGAAIGGTPLKAVNFPWKAGKPVETEERGIPVLGPAALALLPFLAGSAAVLVARSALAPRVRCPVELPDLRIDFASVSTFLETSWTLLRQA